MASRTITQLIDDLDGSDAQRTVPFSIDGVLYEIDLNGDHLKALEESMAEWVGHARKIGGKRSTTGSRSERKGAGSTTERGYDLDALRRWASERSIDLPKRGRVPGKIVQQYMEAQQAS